MAEQGWFLTKITGSFQSFERHTPKQLRYAVEIFDGATDYDTRPEPEAQEYIELCQAAGWEFCGSFGRTFVFCSEAADALPIETDLHEKYRVIRKDLLKSWSSEYISSILLLLAAELYIFFEGYQFFFSAPLNLFLMALLGFVSATGIFKLLQHLRWCHVARKQLKEECLVLRGTGKSVSLTYRRVRLLASLASLLLLGAFACFSGVSSLWVSLILAVLTAAVLLWVSAKKWSRESNKTVSILLGGVIALASVFCVHVLPSAKEEKVYLPAEQVDASMFPLSLTDLEEDLPAYRWAKANREKTFLAQYTYYQDYFMDEPTGRYADELLVYSVYQSRYPKLLADYKAYLMKDAKPERTEQLSETQYGAEEAWWFNNGLLLEYPEKIVWIWPLTDRFHDPKAIKAAFTQ